MSEVRISQVTYSFSGINQGVDILVGVDVSDTTESPQGTTKKLTIQNLMRNFPADYLAIGGTPAALTVGVYVDQQGNDDSILVLGDSTDVAHGMTAVVQTSTYGRFRKNQATAGGLEVGGFSDLDGNAYGALVFWGTLGEAPDNTKTSAGHGVVRLIASEKSGTGRQALSGDSPNLLSLEDNTTTRVIFDDIGQVSYITGDNDFEVFSLPATTGAPLWLWDESEDRWSTNVGIYISAGDFHVVSGFITTARSEITLDVSGVATATGSYHTVDTYNDDATDDLDTLNGYALGRIVILQGVSAARVVTVKDDTGNIKLDANADFPFTSINSRLILQATASGWVELSRSVN
jgi:hypothetical protein